MKIIKQQKSKTSSAVVKNSCQGSACNYVNNYYGDQVCSAAARA